jgi:hypothetical protein
MLAVFQKTSASGSTTFSTVAKSLEEQSVAYRYFLVHTHSIPWRISQHTY